MKYLLLCLCTRLHLKDRRFLGFDPKVGKGLLACQNTYWGGKYPLLPRCNCGQVWYPSTSVRLNTFQFGLEK